MQLQSELREAWDKLMKVANIDELSDWTKKYGDRSTSNRESQTLEYKAEAIEFGILKACCALSNSIGGILLIGVKDELTESNPATCVVGGLNVLDPNRKNFSSSVLKFFRNGFYYSFPKVEVAFIKSIRVTAVLVYGNEPELLIFRSNENALHGYRRKADNSDPMETEEILSIATRWQHQRSMVIERYSLIPHYANDVFRYNRSSSLLVNALPIAPFSSPISTSAFLRAVNSVTEYLPGIQLSTTSLAQSASFSGERNSSFNICCLDKGLYEISITSSLQVDNDPSSVNMNDYIKLLATSVYTCLLISRYLEGAHIWSVQGKFTQFYEDCKPKQVNQRHPIAIDMIRTARCPGNPFPKPCNNLFSQRDVIRAMRICSQALDLDLYDALSTGSRPYVQMQEFWSSVRQ
jgi:hypothetical protein